VCQFCIVFDATAHLEAIHVGEDRVQDDQVRLCLPGQAQAMFLCGCLYDLIPGFAQQMGGSLQRVGFVIYDEYSRILSNYFQIWHKTPSLALW